MGTNYYGRYNLCEHCGRYDEFHIGKNSFGWKFSFEAHPDLGIKSYTELNEFTKKHYVVIYNEYGDAVTWKEFFEIVQESLESEHDHANEYPDYSYHDAEGYIFSNGEFC